MRRPSMLWLIPALALSACAVDEEFDDQEVDLVADEAKADSAGPVATYYSVRRDYRRCVSPLCGGYWVARVNKKTTRCANGRYAKECYVAEIDYSGTALGELDLASFEAEKGLLRGSVEPKTYGSFGNLGVFSATEAWRHGAEDVTISGTYYRLEDKGFVCAKAPCFNIHEAQLNGRYHTDLSGITGPLAEEATPALLKDDELLVAGTNHRYRDPGMVTSGRQVQVTQFWRRVRPTGPSCANVRCAAGTHCEMVEIICITTPCNPVPECVLDADRIVEIAKNYAFAKGDDTYERRFFQTEQEAYDYGSTADHPVLWLAFDGADNKFVLGYVDLWAERFEVVKLSGEIRVTGEH
ncbi:MAG: hypothetical protein HY698_21115 [Deltaproteobacteria bacterium]|nr:hypothetical protein [Deltaproteobacteria bacterium]